MSNNPFATPKTTSRTDSPAKQDLVGQIVIPRVREYHPELPSAYGTTQACFIDELIVATGEHAGRYTDVAWFGLLGRQVGEALGEGEVAPCRIVAGKTKSGGQWVGADFNLDEKDQALALKAYENNAPAPF